MHVRCTANSEEQIFHTKVRKKKKNYLQFWQFFQIKGGVSSDFLK